MRVMSESPASTPEPVIWKIPVPAVLRIASVWLPGPLMTIFPLSITSGPSRSSVPLRFESNEMTFNALAVPLASPARSEPGPLSARFVT